MLNGSLPKLLPQQAVQSARSNETQVGVPGGNTLPTAADIGLTRKDTHMPRQFRDAEGVPSPMSSNVNVRARVQGSDKPLQEGARVCATVAQTRSLAVTRADLLTIAGVLDLERGEPGTATVRFTDALGLYAAAPGFAVSKPGEPLAVRYDKAIRAAR